MSLDVMPFGKYQGESIQTIAEDDPNYFEWLLDQEWFKESKFETLYKKIEAAYLTADYEEW